MTEIVPSFFEGSEKKAELVIDPALPSLRQRDERFWAGLCEAARTSILSRVDNGHCTAFLLSESSLFVFDHKLIMLTCGRTTLHLAMLELLRGIPPELVEMFVYQRKNEAFPHRQRTSFFDDVSEIHQRLPGRAYRFGPEDEHHLYLFHLDRGFAGDPDDVTVEVLMYGVDETVRREFCRGPHPDTLGVRERTGVDRILPGFTVDDHLFDPTGYSLNAIRRATYYTVHVTPEEAGSYASFETNHRWGHDLQSLIGRVLEVFRPRSFDLVVFDHGGDVARSAPGYRLMSHVVQRLDFGYQVRFTSHHRPPPEAVPAVELPLVGRTPERAEP